MVREIVGAAFLLSGCTQQDYGVKVQDPDSGGPVLNFPETISANFDISIDVAFQRTNFGQDVSRCQLQVAMYYYYQSDGFGEREEGPGPDGEGEHGTEDGGQGHGGGRIEHPSEPGECVFSSFEEIPGGQPGGGAWQVRGSIDAGLQIDLIGQNQDLSLSQRTDEQGRIFYELQGCDASVFPFGEVFDLSAPDANMGSDFESLYLSEAIAIGAQIEMTSPGANEIVNGKVYHSNLEDLELAWLEHGETLEDELLGIENQKMVFVRNMRADEHRPVEALACLPTTEHSMLLRSDVLLDLTPNPSASETDYYAAVQVDSQTSIRETVTPWGQLLRARSLITDGGILHLTGE